jgi:hypothetical protein
MSRGAFRAASSLALVSALLLAVHPLAAQARARATRLAPPIAADVGRLPIALSMQGARSAPGRGQYMVLGALIGGVAASLYAGARVASGASGAREAALRTPLIGAAIGAAAGMLWFEIRGDRR